MSVLTKETRLWELCRRIKIHPFLLICTLKFVILLFTDSGISYFNTTWVISLSGFVYRSKFSYEYLAVHLFLAYPYILVLYMFMNFGPSLSGRNVGWGCLKIGNWGEYLGLRGTRWQGERRKLCNDELNDLYWSSIIVREIKSRKMWWAGLVTHTRRGEEYTDFWWENLREEDHFEDPGLDGKTIVRWIFRKRFEGLEWISLVHDRDSSWALVNAVMNLRVPQNTGNFLTGWELVSFSRRDLLHALIN